MLTGRRYLLALSPEQRSFAESIGDACRAVWNTGIEQRRDYARRGASIGFFEQSKQLTEARRAFEWLQAVPVDCLHQTLRDLDKACRRHGTWKVRWRSKARSVPSFRFPAGSQVIVRRVSRRWAEAKLPKFGWVRFRWTRPIDGTIRNATVSRDAGRWYISFCVEDGVADIEPNGKPSVGIDRGVAVAVATSDGRMWNREFVTQGEAGRLRRLQQQLSRQRDKRSNRRRATRGKLASLNARIRARRADFTAWTANRLARDHGLLVVEDLRIRNMTRSTRSSVDRPRGNARQKAGLNRAILAKGWGGFLYQLEHQARYQGAEVVKVNPAFTSQTCNACKHIARESRESQAVFRCVACGHRDNADVNAAKNILAAGFAVTGRGDLGDSRSVKRQPSRSIAA